MIASIEIVIVSRGHPQRVLCRVRAERRDELAGRHAEEDGDDGKEQEEEGDARGQNERRPEETV